MDGKKYQGLLKNVIATAVFCLLLPLVIISFTTINVVQNRLEQAVKDDLQHLAVGKMHEVNYIIANQTALTKAMAQSPFLAAHLENASGAPDPILTSYLTGIFRDAPGLYENFFITCGSMIVGDGLNGTTLHDVADEKFFRECLAKGAFIGNNVSPVTGRPVYVISYAIRNRDEDILGTVNNSIDLGNMTKEILASLDGSNMRMLIIDKDGVVIASANRDQIFSVNFNRENDSTAVVMQKMDAMEAGTVEFLFDGAPQTGAYASADGMHTLVYMPTSEYTGIMESMARRIQIAVIACLLLATLVILKIRLSRDSYKMASERDKLTKVYNKAATEANCKLRLRQQEDGTITALYIIDLDHFKEANDTYGHQHGDLILQEFAKKLQAVFRATDIVGRFGGDEFVVMIDHLPSVAIAERKAMEVLQAARTLTVDGTPANITASIGLAISLHQGLDYDTLFGIADQALYRVKKAGRNGYCIKPPEVVR